MNAILNDLNTALFIRTNLKPFFALKNLVSCTRLHIVERAFFTNFRVKIKVVAFNTLTASPVTILKYDPIFSCFVLTELKVINIYTLSEAFRKIESIIADVTDTFLTAFLAVSHNSITQITLFINKTPCIIVFIASLTIIFIVSYIPFSQLPKVATLNKCRNINTFSLRWIQFKICSSASSSS